MRREMLGDGSGPLFEPGSGRGQVSAATEDGTGPSPAVLTTQVGRLYGQDGDRRSAAIPLGLYVRRWTRWVRAGGCLAAPHRLVWR